jgi:hypothetical protein
MSRKQSLEDPRSPRFDLALGNLELAKDDYDWFVDRRTTSFRRLMANPKMLDEFAIILGRIETAAREAHDVIDQIPVAHR